MRTNLCARMLPNKCRATALSVPRHACRTLSSQKPVWSTSNTTSALNRFHLCKHIQGNQVPVLCASDCNFRPPMSGVSQPVVQFTMHHLKWWPSAPAGLHVTLKWTVPLKLAKQSGEPKSWETLFYCITLFTESQYSQPMVYKLSESKTNFLLDQYSGWTQQLREIIQVYDALLCACTLSRRQIREPSC